MADTPDQLKTCLEEMYSAILLGLDSPSVGASKMAAMVYHYTLKNSEVSKIYIFNNLDRCLY